MIIQNFLNVPGVPNLSNLGPCTESLFGITTRAFSAANPGQKGSPGVAGNYSGTVNYEDGLKFNFSVITDVNTYTAEQAYSERKEVRDPNGQVIPGMVSVSPGYTLYEHPFLNYVQYGLDASSTFKTQVVELGNALYAISGRMNLQQMKTRDNAPNPNPKGYGSNDAPGNDLLNFLFPPR